MQLEFHAGGRTVTVEVISTGDGYRVLIDGAPHEAAVLAADRGGLDLRLDGRRRRAWVAAAGDTVHVCLDGRQHVFVRHTGDEEGGDEAGGGPLVAAPLPGKVVKVLVAAGQAVAAGAPLVILEAMKMETEVTAPLAGVVRTVAAAAGRTVALGEVLVEIAPPPPPAAPESDPAP